MNFTWYKLFSKSAFLAESLVSRTLVVDLEDRGQTQFEIFVGNYISIGYDDGFLPVDFLDRNPYVQGNYAVYKDANDFVYFGFLEAEG